jgi:hypothetical protein
MDIVLRDNGDNPFDIDFGMFQVVIMDSDED